MELYHTQVYKFEKTNESLFNSICLGSFVFEWYEFRKDISILKNNIFYKPSHKICKSIKLKFLYTNKKDNLSDEERVKIEKSESTNLKLLFYKTTGENVYYASF